MTKRRFKLRNLEVDRVDLVDKGANQYAEIVIAKGRDEKRESIATNIRDGYPVDTQLKNGPPPTVRVRRKKKKKKGSADAERNAAEMGSAGAPVAPPAEKPNPFAKHHGPGSHASGSSQDVHGKGGGGSKKPSNAGSSNKGMPRKGRYEIIDTQHPTWRGMRFTDKARAEKELAQSVPPGRFKIKDRGDGESNKGMPVSESDDSGYENWMKQADKEVSRRAGLSIHDLADMNYRDMYEDGLSPKRAAARALRNEGFNGGIPKGNSAALPKGDADFADRSMKRSTLYRRMEKFGMGTMRDLGFKNIRVDGGGNDGGVTWVGLAGETKDGTRRGLHLTSDGKLTGLALAGPGAMLRDAHGKLQAGRDKYMPKWVETLKSGGVDVEALGYRDGAFRKPDDINDGKFDMKKSDEIRDEIRKAFPPPKPKPGVPVDPKAAAVPGKPVPPKPGVKPGMPQLKDVVGKPGAPGAPGAIPGQPAAPAPPGGAGGVGLGIDPSQTPTPGAPTPGAPVAPGAPAPGPAAAPPMGKPAPAPQLSPNPGAPPLGPGSAPGKRPVATPAPVPGKKPPKKAAAPPNPLMDDKKKKLADQMRQKGAPPSGGKPF